MNLINLKKNNIIKSEHFEKNNKSYVKKLLMLSSIFFAVGVVIMIKISELTISDKKNIYVDSITNIKHQKKRGIIYDTNNKVLATNIFLYQLKAYPKLITEPKITAKILKSELASINENKLFRRLSDKSKSEIIVKRNITPLNAKRINALGIPGVEFSIYEKRFYPNQNLASHLVGHVNNKQEGVYGAERTFNDQLEDGKDIHLSVDNRIQHIVREELKKGIQRYKAKSGTAIIADLKRSEILALVSLPDFNPNHSIDPKKNSYRNTATLNLYEMGSTFKIFTVAAALEYSDLKLSSSFDAREPLKISNYLIKDYHPENRILTTKEVFIKSSNIGSSRIALKLGSKNLKSFYNNLGMMNYSKVELFEKSKPLLPKRWGEIETATMSYGHGISITPMHMLEAASLIFSDNSLGKLSIIKKNIFNSVENNLISDITRKKLIKLMEDNVNIGTAKKAKMLGYNIGGKTATSEKINVTGSYDKKKLVSSFLAIFPTEQPRFLSLVLFDEPYLMQGNKVGKYGATGGKTAAPTTARIIENIAQFLNITREIKNDIELIVNNKEKLNFASY